MCWRSTEVVNHQNRYRLQQTTAPKHHRVSAIPKAAPFRAVREVELTFFAGAGLDRHRHLGGRSEAGPPQGSHLPDHRRVGAAEPLGRDDLEHARRQQARRRLDQLVDPTPTGRRPPAMPGQPTLRWRSAALQPLRHRGRVVAHLVGDLGDGPALASHAKHVHVLLLGQHGGGFLRCSVFVTRDAGGGLHRRWWIPLEERYRFRSTANFGDRRS